MTFFLPITCVGAVDAFVKQLDMEMLGFRRRSPPIRLVNLCSVGGGVGWMCTLGTGNGKEGGHRGEREGMQINEAGIIDITTVAWRPLPAVVEVQKLLALKFGMKPLT
jgi:hypothetical protein